MKALVVEDEPEVVEAIILCLSMPWPDITLIATNSGEVAVELARWLEPDIVLLDLLVDDQYGLQALKQIRAFSDVPIVILTANNEEISRHRAMQLGADDYLIKPFVHIDLLGSLKAVLSRGNRWFPSSSIRGQQHEGLIVNLPGRYVSRHGVTIDLTPVEWRLLTALVQGKGGTVPHDVLGRNGPGLTLAAAEETFRTLTMKLGGTESNACLFLSHDDRGFRLVPAS